MTAPRAGTPATTTPRGGWLTPVGLILLSLIPILAGAARLTELTGSPVVTDHNARFVESPLPVIIHIVSVTVFSILGAFQFVPALRRRRNAWHRIAGRILVPAGVLTALSGMWMAVFYSHPVGDGFALSVLRVIFGSAMLVSIGLAVRAIVKRKFILHGAWMTRAYAIGMGAGTQVFTHLPWFVFVGGKPGELPRALMMGAGWVINVCVAEWIIRSRQTRQGAVFAPISTLTSRLP